MLSINTVFKVVFKGRPNHEPRKSPGSKASSDYQSLDARPGAAV